MIQLINQGVVQIHSSEHQPWVITEGTAICTAAPVTLGEAENIDTDRTETETRRRVNVSVVKNLGLITKGNMLPQCLSLCSVIANHWGMNVWCLCSAYFKVSDSLDEAIGPCHVPLGLICLWLSSSHRSLHYHKVLKQGSMSEWARINLQVMQHRFCILAQPKCL